MNVIGFFTEDGKRKPITARKQRWGGFRRTRRDLEVKIEMLNKFSKKKYALSGAYGKWQLTVLADPETGARYNVGPMLPLGQMFDTLDVLIAYQRAEARGGG